MEKVSSFAERLTALLAMRGMSKSQLAKLCGIDKSNVTRYCNGDYEAKQDVVFAIASKLNVQPPWLMGYDVPMKDSVISEDFIQRFASDDPDMEAQIEEACTILRGLPPEARALALASVKGIALQAQSQDSPGGSV